MAPGSRGETWSRRLTIADSGCRAEDAGIYGS